MRMKMFRWAFGACGVMIYGLCLAASMSNSDVIQLLSAGMNEAIVLQAIDTAGSAAFDTSAAGLVKLKKAGASDVVIQRVLSRAKGDKSAIAPSPTAVPSTSAARVVPTSGGQCPVEMNKEGIFVRADGQIIKLPYRSVQVEFSSSGALLSALTFGATKSEAAGSIAVPGVRSDTRLKDRSLKFIDLLVPPGRADSANVITVVRFKLNDTERTAVLASSKTDAISVMNGVKVDSSMGGFRVPVTMERVASDCKWEGKNFDHFRASPMQPFESGEYAYIAGGGNGKSVIVADFGID